MQKETVERANYLLNQISELNEEIKELECGNEKFIRRYKFSIRSKRLYILDKEFKMTDEEIKLLLEWRIEKVKSLEKELEEL